MANDSFKEIKYDAVLVSDLILSLDEAFKLGEGKKNGTSISSPMGTNPATIYVEGAGRYFVAVRSSGVRKNSLAGSERINSGWKLFTDTSGLPQS